MAVADGTYLKAVQTLLMPDDVEAQNAFCWVANFTAEQTDSAVKTAIEDFLEDFYGALVSQIPDNVTLDLADVYEMEWNSTESQWEVARNLGTVSPSVTFTATDDPSPNVVSACLVASTAKPKVHGRKFLPAFAGDQTLDNNLISAAVTAVLVAGSYWIADQTISAGNTLDPGVLSVAVEAFRALTAVTVNSIVGTMRTRKPGIGT